MGINFGSNIIAHYLTTGKEKWSVNVEGKSISGLIMVGNYVCFGDSTGYVGFLDKETGKLVLYANIDGSITNSLSYANGIFYGTSSKRDKTNIVFAIE